MKINTPLDFQGNEIKLATPEKVTTLPVSNLFIGRTCILISEKEVDETTISVGSMYYYNGEQWCQIEEPLKIDETKINVIDDEITIHKFDTLSDAKTYINSNNKPKSVIIGSNTSVTSIDSGAFSGCTSLTSIDIPNSVTSIGSGAFYNCKSLTSIYIPSGVTSIGANAFMGCSSLVSINIPDGVTSIGSQVFQNCTSLTSISITWDSNITSIGKQAFSGCKSLTYVTIPDRVTSIGANAFQSCKSLTDIYIPSNVTSIGNQAFHGCSSLISITIPSGVTSIGAIAFQGCTSLISITIPRGVTSIGESIFRGCISLTRITIPDTVTSIGTIAFSDCTSLKSITIPDSVTSIGSNAFAGCDILILDNYKSRTGYPWGATSILIQNEDVTTTINDSSTDRQVPTAKTVYSALYSGSLDNTKINVIDDEIAVHKFDSLSDAATYIKSDDKPKSVVIGSNTGVTSIGTGVFNGCTSLASITIPSSVTSIGINAFSGCTSLKSIDIPSRVTITSIGSSVFYNCTSLTSITIPNSVTSIGSGAFMGCSALTSINIPSRVTSIGSNAFNGCTSLTFITIPNSVTSIGSNAFYGCDILILDNYKSRTGYPWGATDILIQNEDVTTTIDENSTDRQVPTAKTVYGALSSYSLDQTKINVIDDEITVHKFDTLADARTYIRSNDKPKSVIIGSDAGITSISGSIIGNKAFASCKSLTSITIPSSVTDISYAFIGCSALTSINIPSGVTSIGSGAFMGCSALTSINIPSSVTSIGSGAFNGCSSLTSITIPSGVTSIASSAFSGCDILLLDNYKSREGYPWGATDILIQNEDVTTTIDSNSTDRQVPTANGVYNFIMENMFSIKFDMDYLKEYIERTITSIDIPDGVTYIGNGSFYNCTSLTSITIPSSVTNIHNNAFSECTSLTSITIDKPEGSISGAPWNAPIHPTVTWTG